MINYKTRAYIYLADSLDYKRTLNNIFYGYYLSLELDAVPYDEYDRIRGIIERCHNLVLSDNEIERRNLKWINEWNKDYQSLQDFASNAIKKIHLSRINQRDTRFNSDNNKQDKIYHPTSKYYFSYSELAYLVNQFSKKAYEPVSINYFITDTGVANYKQRFGRSLNKSKLKKAQEILIDLRILTKIKDDDTRLYRYIINNPIDTIVDALKDIENSKIEEHTC